jgi:hypothetical protein
MQGYGWDFGDPGAGDRGVPVGRNSQVQVCASYIYIYIYPLSDLPHLTVRVHRQKLGVALNRASDAQDNHLRGLLLAFISSHFLHTAPEDAERMLSTCETLAAGLGAPAHKLKSGPASPDKTRSATSSEGRVGNATLRLWVGERFLGTVRQNFHV